MEMDDTVVVQHDSIIMIMRRTGLLRQMINEMLFFISILMREAYSWNMMIIESMLYYKHLIHLSYSS